MRVPYRWLGEWVEIPWKPRELGARLTLAGLELESLLDTQDGDSVLEFGITPNRGDAMSVRGIAREVAALTGKTLAGKTVNALAPIAARSQETFPIERAERAACPKFAGRVIRGIRPGTQSPAWLRERLDRCGVRSIHPVVDITNYVMLELGTPMHAYDLAKLQGGITVRFAAAGERLRLLDGQEVEFSATAPAVLVIADGQGPVGIAGVMGGERTAVGAATTDVFFEVAFFKPEVVGATARRLGLITDAAQRFERGVDAYAQEQAIERATQLLLEIAGGEPGPTVVQRDDSALPQASTVTLRRQRLERMIGIRIPDDRVQDILRALGMQVQAVESGWSVLPPSHRFDIAIEADLVEEVARIFGYDAVPEAAARLPQTFDRLPEGEIPAVRALSILVDRGYQEAITYSFVDPQLQKRLFPDTPALTLRNPISADMAAMRVSLWPGLLQAARENLRRQQSRVRLVEYGSKFFQSERNFHETKTLSGVAVGAALEEQWGEQSRPVDFFDVKGDLEAVIAATGRSEAFSFADVSQARAVPPCLHPGRSACIFLEGAQVGWIGELHPETVKALDLTYTPIVFELETPLALLGERPAFQELSRFPSIRRDLAVIVDEAVTFQALRGQVRAAAGGLLREMKIFDVYRGQGIDSGRKSVALGLILQDSSRTLTDPDADRVMTDVMDGLHREFNAFIRAS